MERKELIPFVSVAIIGIGIIKQLFFYSYFKIPITQFMDVTEIIMQFSEDLILIVCALIIGTFFMWYVDKKADNYIESNLRPVELKRRDKIEKEEYKKLSKEEQTKLLADIEEELEKLNAHISKMEANRKRAKILILLINIVVTTFFLVRLSLLIFQVITSNKFIENSIHIFWTVFAFILLLEMWFLSREIFEPYKKHLPIFLAIPLTVLMVLAVSTFQIDKVSKGKYIGTRIYTKDSTYISDSSSFFIGKTNNYTFIWNKSKNSSTILSNSEIQKMELKSKRYFSSQ